MRVVTVPVLWLLLAVASPLRCSAQYLLFDNYVSGRIDGRVVDDEGTLLGTNYMAQLYAGPTTNSLLPVPDPVEFLMSLGHPTGTVPAGAVRVPGVKARDWVYVRMRAWAPARTLPTYEDALAKGQDCGQSVMLYLQTATLGSDATPLDGIQPFRVTRRQAPAVAMTEPAPGSVFVAGSTVSVGATATDVNTTVDPLDRVTKVEFYDGATHLYTDTSPPYQYDWTKPPAGIRTLQAVATDTYGLQRTSAVVSVVVSYRPTVALTFPTNGAVFGAPAHLPLVATASDADDTVQQVAFYSGGNLIGSATESPFSVPWTGVAAGDYTLTAVATDSYGLSRTSAPVSIRVAAPPTVEWVSPPDGSVSIAPANLVLMATAADSDGTVEELRFYRGDIWLATLTIPPYELAWNALPQGVYSLRAVALDSDGLSATSAPATIVVSERPIVQLTAPTEGAVYSDGVTFPLTAAASDTDSTIASVAFYDGGTAVGTATVAPFTISWSTPVAGTHALSAVAVDGYGIGATSAPVHVRVLGPPVFSFSSATYSASEADDAVTVTVNKAPDTRAGSVNYITEAGTARPHSLAEGVGDYQTALGALTFARDDVARQVAISIVKDTSYEGDQDFTARLLNPGEGGSVGSPGVTTVTIIDDDPPWTTNTFTGVVFPSGITNQPGRLTVRLDPPAANGQWRIAWDLYWRNSGQEITGLPPGNYEIEFRPAPGYLQPASATTEVRAGEQTSLSGYYVQADQAAVGSLIAVLQPAALATEPNLSLRAQWRISGESTWRDSSTAALSQLVGSHVVEFKPVTGYATPAARMATVLAGQANELVVTYEALPSTPGVLTPVPFVDLNDILDDLSLNPQRPSPFCGQLLSDVGYGTGFVVRKHVVLTAAHVLFNDRDYAYVDQVRWFFQRERGEYDPPPQLPRGWYVFGGYAAQRQADNSPGVSSTASQNLDVGVLYFRDPAGRGGYCGYLVSEEAGSEWLELPFKMLLGYPVDTVAETNRGRMHYTPPADVAFSLVENRVFASTGIQSYPGNSGGPLCVLLSTNSNNFYYPAAIYIGGGTRSVVRAIDGAVAALINQAEMMADTGDTNYVGGGVPMAPSTGGASPFQPGYLRVELSPANAIAAGGGWRILGSGNTNYVNDNLARLPLLPATYTVEFRPAAGYQTPTNRPATVVAGSDVTTVLTVEYLPVQTVVAPHLAMGSNTFRLSIQGIPGARYQVVASSNLLDWEIVADNPNVTGGVWEFSDPGVSNRPLRFYRGRAP